MPVPITHTITLTERVVDPQLNNCPFLVSCSCNWQGLTHSRERAESFIAAHSYAQKQGGHSVIIERELLPVPPPEKAKDAKPSVVDGSKTE